MTGTLRRFAALLALLALSLSVAEKGWAAACVESGSPSAQSVVESGASHAHHSSDLVRTDNGPTGDPDGDSSSCPMAVASGMACGAVALGSSGTLLPLALDLSNDLQSLSDHPVGIGALSSLFRPPQP